MRLLTVQLSPVVFFFFIEGPNIFHASLLSNTLHLCLPLTWEIKFHTHVKAGEIEFPLYFSVCVHKLQTGKQNCGLNGSRHLV